MRIHVGCSGWFYSHWRGIFYPRQEVTTKNWFGYYANVFQTVELNAPFYRWPKPATVRHPKKRVIRKDGSNPKSEKTGHPKKRVHPKKWVKP